MRDCIPWEEPHAGAGKEHKEEGEAEVKCHEGGKDRGVENGVRLSLERRGWGEVI